MDDVEGSSIAGAHEQMRRRTFLKYGAMGTAALVIHSCIAASFFCSEERSSRR